MVNVYCDYTSIFLCIYSSCQLYYMYIYIYVIVSVFARQMHSTTKFAMTVLSKCLFVCVCVFSGCRFWNHESEAKWSVGLVAIYHSLVLVGRHQQRHQRGRALASAKRKPALHWMQTSETGWSCGLPLEPAQETHRNIRKLNYCKIYSKEV